MEKQLVERRRGDDVSAIAIDRLSQLPQHILHSILSLLSQKDAFRTSVLSKSWRYLWHGRLDVEFDDRWFAGKEEIQSFLGKTLQNLSIQQLLVNMHSDSKSIYGLLEKWIPLVMNVGVRSLSMIISTLNYGVPLVVFQAERLVELHLQGFILVTLKPTDNVMLNNLQTLRLHRVEITDETLEKIISSCPLIQNVDLIRCRGLKSIKSHKHRNIKNFGFEAYCSLDQILIQIEDPHTTLESVRIRNCRNCFFHHDNNMHFPHLKSLNLHEVQLPAEIFNNLSSFFPCLDELMLDSCHGCPNWFLQRNITHFPHLKSLNLHKVQLPEDIFNNFSSFLPCLSQLILESCYGFEEFLLSSCSIKHLTIKMDWRRIKAFIDTPNLLYFEYSCYGFLPSIKFATTSNEWESYISVLYERKRLGKDATSWFLKLKKLLKALSQSQITLNLIRGKYENLHINDSYGGFYKPVVVKHLRLSGYFSSSSVPAILNGFFRICHPRYIYTDQYTNGHEKENNILAEFICKLISKEIGCYFWLQDLEEVSLEVQDMEGKEWHCVEGTSLPALPSNLFEREIRFRLAWRE